MNKIVIITTLLLAFGCGGGSSKTKISTKIPIKIEIEMPKVITVSDDEFREYSGEQEKTSIQRVQDENNYRQIKPITLKIKQRFNNTKFNIAMVNSVISEIEGYCKDTPINKVCKIPKGSIEFSFNKHIINKLIGFVGRKRISDVDENNLIGKSSYFGSIEFVHYDKNSSYEYSLMIDNSDIENMFFGIIESKPYIRTIKWSRDKQKIFYSSLTDSKSSTLYYQNIPNIGEKAHLTSFTSTQTPFLRNAYIYDLSREDNSTDFLLNIQTMDEERIQGFQKFYQKHAYLKILEKNGYCSTDFYNRYPEIFFNENGIIQELYYNSTIDMSHNIFDENGTIVASRYCEPFANATAGDLSAQAECKYEDITTWTTTTNNKLIFKPFDKLYFRELDIGMNFSTEEGYLKAGEYFLLPPKLNVTNLRIEDVLKYSVASFVVFVSGIEWYYGFIYDKSYTDIYDETVHKKLNQFQIVYATYNNDLNLSLNKRVKEFKLLRDEVKPEIW